MSIQDFINTYYVQAAAVSSSELPPAFILAHAFLESGRGESKLTKIANNFFGIKALRNAPYITLSTKEVINGKEVTLYQNFARYPTPADGFKAYANLLKAPRYQKVLQARTNLKRAQELKAGGYFTAGNAYVNTLSKLASQFEDEIKKRPDFLLVGPILGLLFIITYLASSKI
jgi:flagellum-specific peptidoglycan hydrolase FlgJ